MLKVALPHPSFDAVSRGEERPFDDVEPPYKRLTHAEALEISAANPALSPWRVIAAQVVFGLLAGVVGGVIGGEIVAWSALYGAAVVALPGALMARGATSRLSSLSPVISAVSMLGWGFVKLVLSVAMLVLAARIVPGLVWPAMLVSMVLCLQTYWFALLWRSKNETTAKISGR